MKACRRMPITGIDLIIPFPVRAFNRNGRTIVAATITKRPAPLVAVSRRGVIVSSIWKSIVISAKGNGWW